MQTRIILLERIAKLGQLGDIVSVKAGYARNFLLPQGKALRANKANIAYFETQKTELEARNLERKNDAEKVGEKLGGKTVVAIRSAGETGQLYGSVAARDVVALLDDEKFKVEKSQVKLQNPIKTIGMHEVTISLHAEVEIAITINVARSEDEAKRQEAGEDLTKDQNAEVEQEEDTIKPEEVFEKKDDVEKFAKDDDEDTSDEEASTDDSQEPQETEEKDDDKDKG